MLLGAGGLAAAACFFFFLVATAGGVSLVVTGGGGLGLVAAAAVEATVRADDDDDAKAGNSWGESADKAPTAVDVAQPEMGGMDVGGGAGAGGDGPAVGAVALDKMFLGRTSPRLMVWSVGLRFLSGLREAGRSRDPFFLRFSPIEGYCVVEG